MIKFAVLFVPIVISFDREISSMQDQITEKKIEEAVEKGLKYLEANQNEDGSWSCLIGQKAGEQYHGKNGKHVGVTSLAGIALMMNGSFSERGKYHKSFKKTLDFVLSCVTEDGYITYDGTRMYSHAFATLFLSYAYGMTKRDDIKQKLKKSVNLMAYVQNKDGGWRYSPSPTDADISITVTVLQSLRAAKTTGISVPIDTIAKASKYIKDCATSHGFSYQNKTSATFNDTRVTYSLTAAGIVSLQSMGTYDSAEIKKGLHRLKNYHELKWGKYHYFYGHYYASQAMYLAGVEYWKNYFKLASTEIVSKQNENGSWKDDVGPTYATAMACIILQIPNETFPIFQK